MELSALTRQPRRVGVLVAKLWVRALCYFANVAIRPFGPTAQPSPVAVNPTLL